MNLEEKVKAILIETIGVGLRKENIKTEATLESLGLDSLDQIEFIMAVEEEFNIIIEDSDYESWKTFGDVVIYLEGRKK